MAESVDDSRMAVICTALRKHLTRSPIPDEDIKSALVWAQHMIGRILTDANGSDGDPPGLGSRDTAETLADDADTLSAVLPGDTRREETSKVASSLDPNGSSSADVLCDPNSIGERES